MINIVNNIAEQEAQPEGIEFSDMHGRIALQDFANNANEDDSNASDNDFKLDEEYQEEVDNEIALEKEEGSVGNDDPDLQEDYFHQNPVQQHDTAVANNNEPVPDILENCTRSGNVPIVALANSITPSEKQECDKHKKKKIDDENTSITDNLDDVDTSNNNNAKVEVSGAVDDEEDTVDNDNDGTIPKELDSDLGPYWALAQSAQAYVLNTIASYSNKEA
jgi:hypothetical protein